MQREAFVRPNEAFWRYAKSIRGLSLGPPYPVRSSEAERHSRWRRGPEHHQMGRMKNFYSEGEALGKKGKRDISCFALKGLISPSPCG